MGLLVEGFRASTTTPSDPTPAQLLVGGSQRLWGFSESGILTPLLTPNIVLYGNRPFHSQEKPRYDKEECYRT